MKTHCAIQDQCCPYGYTHCCLECELGKQQTCEDRCLNHIAKCRLGSEKIDGTVGEKQ